MDLILDNPPFILDRDCHYPQLPNDYLIFLARFQKPRTIEKSAYELTQYLEWCERSARDYEKATENDIWDYTATITGGNRTYNGKVDRVCDFYKYAARFGINNPVEALLEPRNLLHRRAEHGRQIRIVSKAALWKFLQGFQVKRDALLAKIFYLTGLRLSELRTLPRTFLDISPSDGVVEYTVTGKGGVRRTLQMGIKQRNEIAEYAKTTTGPFIFSWDGVNPISADTVGKVFRKNATKTGIRVHPHMLRHMYATDRLRALEKEFGGRAGINAALRVLQMELGHKSIETTSIYLHVASQQEASNSLRDYQEQVQKEIECRLKK